MARRIPTIKISIAVENAAFQDGGGAEVASILRMLADKYENTGRLDIWTQIRDINGNYIGDAVLKGGA